MGDAGPCGCNGVALDADLQRRLREHFTGCLCLSCLRALADGAALDAPRAGRQCAAALR
jgi:hypothetical protein